MPRPSADPSYLFDFLLRADLAPGHVYEDFESWSSPKLVELSQELPKLLPAGDRSRASPFKFVANQQLSGAPNPCAMGSCRLKAATDLALFASWYAESVHVHTSVPDLSQLKRVTPEATERLATSIEILFRWQPLIEAGLIKFVSRDMVFCPHCYREVIAPAEPTIDAKLHALESYLREQYHANVRFYTQTFGTMRMLQIEGPPELIEHGKVAEFMPNIPGLSSYFRRGGRRAISTAAARRNGLFDRWISPTMTDFCVQSWLGVLEGANYLTSRPLDLALADQLHDPDSAAVHRALVKAFSHRVPILPDLSLDQIVSLRTAEPEAFASYRSALRRGLGEARAAGKDELSAFNDLVAPELTKLNMQVSNAYRALTSSVITQVGVTSAFIAVGLFTGLISAGASAVVGALGGLDFMKGVGEAVRSYVDVDAPARDSDYYFLWRASKLERSGEHQ